MLDIQERWVDSEGSKGIRQWPINLCTFAMIIQKLTPFVDYNQWLKRLDIQLNEPINRNLIKVPKVIKPTNKKTIL